MTKPAMAASRARLDHTVARLTIDDPRIRLSVRSRRSLRLCRLGCRLPNATSLTGKKPSTLRAKIAKVSKLVQNPLQADSALFRIWRIAVWHLTFFRDAGAKEIPFGLSIRLVSKRKWRRM